MKNKRLKEVREIRSDLLNKAFGNWVPRIRSCKQIAGEHLNIASFKA